MYFLHDTHHGTVFTTFYLIYWLEIKVKTCQFGNILDLTTRSTSSQRFFGINYGCGEKNCLITLSKTFLIIIVGFVIRKNVSTSEPFARDLVPILDSSKSLAEFIHQVDLAARPSLVYSNNDIKSAQTGGGSSVLQMLSLTIVHTTIFLSGDYR